jgi:hypothetical protein
LGIEQALASTIDCRLTGLTFDIASSAGWYSSIAGVLAGFALLAILLPLDHIDDDTDEAMTSDAVVVFVSAFFSLLILSFAYAVLAGRTGSGAELGVAAYEQLTLGGAFGLSTILLLLGLSAVLRSYGANRFVFAPAHRIIRVMVGILGPALVLAMQFSSALDVERVRLDTAIDVAPVCDALGFPAGVWVNLVIVVASIAGVFLLAAFRHRVPLRRSATTGAARVVLGLTVFLTAWSSVVVPLLPASVVISPVLEHGALLISSVGALAVAYAAWASR